MKHGQDKLKFHKAKQSKNDEYYTRLEDIERELQYYSHCLEDKIIYLNCDDPEFSNFYRYFVKNFKKLKLRELISTYYNPSGNSKKTVVSLNNDGSLFVNVEPLEGNGDFKSEECVEILKSADVIITNPPFSLWRDFLDLVTTNKKDFLIIGPLISLGYKIVFDKIKSRDVFAGVNELKYFIIPESDAENIDKNKLKRDENGDLVKGIPSLWYTNLHCEYNDELKEGGLHPALKKCDNEDILNLDKIAYLSFVPADYEGLIAAPITILINFPFEDFELLYLHSNLCLNNKKLFKRVIFKRRGENN